MPRVYPRVDVMPVPDAPESVILAKVHQALAATGRVVLWRNQTGALPAVGRAGKVYPVKFGLGVGGADLVGLLRPSGRFIALEVKTQRGKRGRDISRTLGVSGWRRSGRLFSGGRLGAAVLWPERVRLRKGV